MKHGIRQNVVGQTPLDTHLVFATSHNLTVVAKFRLPSIHTAAGASGQTFLEARTRPRDLTGILFREFSQFPTLGVASLEMDWLTHPQDLS